MIWMKDLLKIENRCADTISWKGRIPIERKTLWWKLNLCTLCDANELHDYWQTFSAADNGRATGILSFIIVAYSNHARMSQGQLCGLNAIIIPQIS